MSKPQLPLELWLTICELLGNAERKAISLCCRTLFVLINTSAPFRAIMFKTENKYRLSALQAMQRPLLSAVEISWELSFKKSPPQNTSSITSANYIVLENLLYILSQSSNLRTLSLSGVDVTITQQEAILSIPTLEHLTLSGSNFIAGAITEPSRSSVKRLQLAGQLSPSAIRHALTRLFNSIEELVLLPIHGKRANLVVMESRLPHLKVLRHWQVDLLQLDGPEWMAFIRSHPTITHFDTSRILPSSPDVLPNLEHLTGDADTAQIYVPGRPVRTYFQENLDRTRTIHLLVALGKSTGPLVRLRLISLSESSKLLELIANNLPQLESLQLYIARDSLGDIVHLGEVLDYGYLLGRWCFSRPRRALSVVPRPRRALPRPPHFTRLKEIEVRFLKDVFYPFPRAQCEVIFHKVLLAFCPHLQVAEFIAVLPWDKFSGREAIPAYRMKMQRLNTGGWEERKWT